MNKTALSPPEHKPLPAKTKQILEYLLTAKSSDPELTANSCGLSLPEVLDTLSDPVFADRFHTQVTNVAVFELLGIVRNGRDRDRISAAKVLFGAFGYSKKGPLIQQNFVSEKIDQKIIRITRGKD